MTNLTHSNLSTFQCFITEAKKYFHPSKKLERSTMAVDINQLGSSRTSQFVTDHQATVRSTVPLLQEAQILVSFSTFANNKLKQEAQWVTSQSMKLKSSLFALEPLSPTPPNPLYKPDTKSQVCDRGPGTKIRNLIHYISRTLVQLNVE